MNASSHSTQSAIYAPFAAAMPERSAQVLSGAVEALETRFTTHGEPIQGFDDVARLWSVILEHPVEPWQVALCLDAVKTARIMANPAVLDHWVDKAGYSALGAAMVDGRVPSTLTPPADSLPDLDDYLERQGWHPEAERVSTAAIPDLDDPGEVIP